ncbi:MAG: HAMP domain-containing histidine kinase, partial [Pseudomonadota bacterium]|nr:HAMP domain-containing histidine kinase [Pseudomonadota bacterium]
MPGPVGPDDPGLAFLGRLAHDLRGPLSPLQTAAYLLRREDIGPQRQRELLDIIDRQATRLGSMLQEMSDWMRARKGNVGTRREPVNVSLLIELACAELVAAGGVVDLPEELDNAEVYGDTQHLVQMLGTLVGYMRTRAGDAGVRVLASLSDGRLEVVIESQGGVDDPASEAWFAHSIETLFTTPEPAPFDEGLGLRLLIAGAIVEAHGGKVSASVSAGAHSRLVV